MSNVASLRNAQHDFDYEHWLKLLEVELRGIIARHAIQGFGRSGSIKLKKRKAA